MTKKIRKAVFPVAGLGTRVLPATKVIPKEMLTVVDRPVLQHCVEEAREAGIEHFIFVTGRNKAVIEDHFDLAYELEDTLAKRGKTKELEALLADPAALSHWWHRSRYRGIRPGWASAGTHSRVHRSPRRAWTPSSWTHPTCPWL